MPIVLKSRAVRVEDDPDKLLINIDDNMVRQALITAMSSEVEFISISNELNEIQDELKLIVIDAEFKKMLINYTSKIIISTGEYEVNTLCKEILNSGCLSSERSIASVLSQKSSFSAKESIENMMRYMYENVYPEYVDISLSPKANIMLRTKEGIFEIKCKNKFTKEGLCGNCVNNCPISVEPSEMQNIRDYLLSRTSEYKSREFHEIGYTRMAYPLHGFGRLRVTIGTQRDYPDLSIRKIPSKVIPLEKFYLSSYVQNWMLSRVPGLYLAVGRPRSGKTALLASLIYEYTQIAPLKIETLENPIEYVFKHGKGIVNQIEIGEDIITIADACRKLLTDDPDIVMITEIRTAEDIRAAIDLANAGIVVYATFHGKSVSSVFKRVRTMFKNEDETYDSFLNVIRAVIYQELIEDAKGAVTPVHGVLINNQSVSIDLDTDEQAIDSILMRSNSPQKHFINDLYNLHLEGILPDSVIETYRLLKDKSIDYKVYSESSPNYETLRR